MTDITELAQRMKAAAEKATPGEWWADEVKNEGCYGSGDDCVEGFTSYAIYGSDGQTLFDSLNSDAACICEEYDGEGHVAWDETAQRNAEFIALANPANVLALVEALEKARQRITQMESRTVTDWIEHDGKWRPESLGLDELVYLKTRKQELKIPYPAGKVKGWMNTGGDMDVMAYKLASPQASTVTVKLPLPRRKTADDYVDDTFEPCDLAAVYNACRLECEVKFKNALTAAGIKVEAE
ncbi:ead/Ea22-like family protein [Klebsiella pneumoniae]|uniref:ead/Ea22-like family protein n=1 Tax=Klebsiella pneumoniae TaxID=573 RepID=UPI001E60C102|nr:ead/Ea22-like family protein [Klebsiella pneumoniae]